MRKNIKLRRAVTIILAFFIVFISTAVFVLFKTSVKHDTEHIRIVGLTGEVEREILRSRSWVAEIRLDSDDRLRETRLERIVRLSGVVYVCRGVRDTDYARFRQSNVARCRDD